MSGARAEIGVLCVAVSSLFGCGRSGLDPSAGASGGAGSAGVADTTGIAGMSGVASTAGHVGSAGLDGGAGTPECAGLVEAACKATPNCRPYICPCSNQETFIACFSSTPERPPLTCPVGICPAAGAIDAGDGAADASGDAAMDGTSPPFSGASVAACSEDGWCWSTPLPQGNPLFSVSGSSASDVWAVGSGGMIIHWDGKAWTQVPSGSQAGLVSVWSGGASDVWAVGDATVLYWNGSTWSPAAGVPTPPICSPTAAGWNAVWGSGPSDVWIVGACEPPNSIGATVHWDGNQWTPFTPPESLSAVWGTGPDDAWALGSVDAHLFHWDGQSWTVVSTGQFPPHGVQGSAIWGTSSSDIWLGDSKDIPPSHWNGMAVEANAGTSGVVDDGFVNALWGSSSQDVWAVGGRYSSDQYWVEGVILHWNGVAWDELPSSGTDELFGVWGSRSDDVWAVGDWAGIVHWDGHAWSTPTGPAPPLLLYNIWGGGPDDVWAFGDDELGLGALHWNGQTWARTELLDAATLGASAAQWATCPGGDCEAPGTIPRAVWGSGSDDIWVGASNGYELRAGGSPSFFVHWDGHAWSLDSSLDAGVAASMRIGAMWGNGPNDVWAVGEVAGDAQSGVAVHWDGTSWSPVTSLSSADQAHAFQSIWSSGPTDVWIGAATAVLHWDGQTWSQPISGSYLNNYVVGGSGPSDVWAVTPVGGGMPSAAAHWNGTSWQPLTVPGIIGPASIVALSPTNAWLHDYGSVAHWDGTAWAPSDADTREFPGDNWPGPSNFYWDGTQVWTIAVDGVIHHP